MSEGMSIEDELSRVLEKQKELKSLMEETGTIHMSGGTYEKEMDGSYQARYKLFSYCLGLQESVPAIKTFDVAKVLHVVFNRMSSTDFEALKRDAKQYFETHFGERQLPYKPLHFAMSVKTVEDLRLFKAFTEFIFDEPCSAVGELDFSINMIRRTSSLIAGLGSFEGGPDGARQ